MGALVSIIIPVFNSQEFLAKTLQSVQDQTYTDWECIIIDDGSEDTTSAIAQSFVDKNHQFHFYKRNRSPKGASTCRNIGIEQANGEYLLFLDSDDLLHPKCLERRIHFMTSNQHLDFAVFQMEAFGRNKLKMTKRQKNYLEAFLRFDFPWQTTCPFWKAGFIRELNGFNENLYCFEDPELHIRAIMHGAEFIVLTDLQPDCYYRSSDTPGQVKNSLYYQFQKFYAIYLTSPEFIRNLKKPQRRLMQHGIARLIKSMKAPIEPCEINLLNEIGEKAKNLGIISSVKHELLKIQSQMLINISNCKLQQILIFFLACQFIHPVTVYKTHINDF